MAIPQQMLQHHVNPMGSQTGECIAAQGGHMVIPITESDQTERTFLQLFQRGWGISYTCCTHEISLLVISEGYMLY